MRDNQIYAVINEAAENVQKAVGTRMMLYERLIKEICEQLGGIFLLINSIPIVGILLRKLIERYIRRYQKILQAESIKLYQQAKKENKNGLDSDTRKGQGST